jgi:hypothetical protein
LLDTTRLVKRNDFYIQRILEICDRGIVERDVSIFSDSEETKLRSHSSGPFRVGAADLLQVFGRTIDLMKLSE